MGRTMSKEPNSTGPFTSEEPSLEEAGIGITLRVIAVAMGGGLVGTLLMLPLLAGVPLALGLLQTESIVTFSTFGVFLGLEPSVTLGIVLFLIGGTTVLPLLFLIVGAFLPPEQPRYRRGTTYGTVFWVGFIFTFWPDGGVLTVMLFLVISLVSHWIYGTALGYVVHSIVGVPQHNV